RMRGIAVGLRQRPVTEARARLATEAEAILAEDLAANKAIGDHGAHLVPTNARILTHCNAGALATAGYGTALGIVRSAHAQGKVTLLWVDETRPVMQGSRLTAWECVRDGIPHRLVAGGVAGLQPGVRCDAGRTHRRDRHRARGVPAALPVLTSLTRREARRRHARCDPNRSGAPSRRSVAAPGHPACRSIADGPAEVARCSSRRRT